MIFSALISAVSCSAACTLGSTPVCGNDGVTYDNVCDLNDAKAKKVLDSACKCKMPEMKPNCRIENGCTADFDQNSCTWGIASSTNNNNPDPSAACALGKTPVCGNDGVTYDNVCYLNNAKAKKVLDSACKCKRPDMMPTCNTGKGAKCTADFEQNTCTWSVSSSISEALGPASSSGPNVLQSSALAGSIAALAVMMWQ